MGRRAARPPRFDPARVRDLYEDYRFALADLFLKQALTLLALVAIVMTSYMLLEPSLSTGGTTALGLLFAGWIGTALLFPALRRAVTWFVDRIVLSRANYSALVDRVTAAIEPAGRSMRPSR